MLFLMISFLMIQLQSFSRLFLVLSIVPIARNAVILVEQIETEREQRSQPWEAVVEATVSRFRPIVLTGISTVLGLIPIAPTVFWGPMAFAIMRGLLVATVLTLIVTPAVYVVWFRIGEPKT
jgi:multidrug efflux pump